jgi:glycosyltransferase involved in cell wall biosynthesis
VARNEAATIGQTVLALSSIDGVRTVAVVDGASSDGTREEAERAGAMVFAVGSRGGKGGALEAAFDRLPDGDVLLLVDGDVGETAREAGALLSPVIEGRADLAVGVLPPQDGGGFGLVKRLSGAVIARIGFTASEPLSGQRAARRSALESCRPFASGFGLETAMTLDAVRLGFRVVEVPVEMRHRATGRDVAGFLHRGRQGLDLLRAAVPRLAGLR